jgi:hypothetical protein
MSNAPPTPLAWWKTPWAVWCLVAVVAAAGLLGVIGMWRVSDVEFVKQARLAGYPDEPLGDVLEQFLGAAQWQAAHDADGQHYVSVSGRVDYLDAATAVLRFRVDSGRGVLGLDGLMLDGRPQGTLVQSDFLRRAYAHYEKALLRR